MNKPQETEIIQQELPTISFTKTKQAEHFIIESFGLEVRAKTIEEAHKYFKKLIKQHNDG